MELVDDSWLGAIRVSRHPVLFLLDVGAGVGAILALGLAAGCLAASSSSRASSRRAASVVGIEPPTEDHREEPAQPGHR